MEEINLLEHINTQMALNVHTANADDTLDHIVATYPYFIPARYIKAAKTHAHKGYSSEMLSAIRPYLGNWLHFQEFLAGNTTKSPLSVPETSETTPELAPAVDQVVAEPAIAAIVENDITIEEIQPSIASEEEVVDDTPETTEIAVEAATAILTEPTEQKTESEITETEELNNEEEEATIVEEALQEDVVAKEEIEEPIEAITTTIASEDAHIYDTINEAIEGDIGTEIAYIEPVIFEEAVAEELETVADESIEEPVLSTDETIIEVEAKEDEKAAVVTPNEAITDFFAQIKLENRAVFEKSEEKAPETNEVHQPHTYTEAIGLEAITLVKEEPTVELVEEENIDNSIIKVAIEMLSDDTDEEEPTSETTQEENIDNSIIQAAIEMLDDDTVDEEATSESIQEENIDNSIIQAAIEMLDDDVDEQVELDVVDAEVESLTEATLEEEKEPEIESKQEEAKVDAAAEALELVETTEDAEMEPFTAVEIISETTEVEPLETEATLEEVTADLEAISKENTSTQQWPSDIAIELTALPAEHEAGNELLQGLNKVLTKHNTKTHFSDTKQDLNEAMTNEPIFTHLATEDYFLQQGIKISNDLPADITEISPALAEQRLAEIILNDEHSSEEEKNKALMVMMSFTDWLLHFKNKKEENATTIEDKRHIKSMWQKEKLAAALEEEDDEIPEEVFEMAVNSITQEDDLASESLAEIYLQQGKHDKAIEMYKKLSLRNPEKNAYFALKIKDIIKEK